MKSFATTILLAVAPFVTFVAAKPELPPAGVPFYLKGGIDIDTGKTAPFTGAFLNANGNRFWFLKPTTREVCEDCYSGTQAVFLPVPGAEINGPDFSKNQNATLRLNTEDPLFHGGPGQHCYVAPDGAFSFSKPHQHAPSGSITTGFQGGDIAEFQLLDPKYIDQNKGALLQVYACKEGNAYAVYYKRHGVALPANCARTILQSGGALYAAKRYL